MAAALSERYGVEFTQVGANLYRDGADSVAWHGDRVARELPEAVVALVSLGAPRPFRLRPTGGGASVGYVPGPGDLLVMGGSCQRTWQHAVPKMRVAAPRMSVQFRHAYMR
jgi:alkylated DNA repair dioxygenase AlkB